MSRIEDALEKASRLRSGSKSTESQPKAADKTVKPRPRVPGIAPVSHPHLVGNDERQSPVSEEYKKLKTKVMKMTQQDPFKNVIMVTSAVGGEGKTITAANLALSLSKDYDHSVLLIDADTRKPSLHTLFNLKPGVGLSDCLANDIAIGSALIRVGNGNVMFLPSGKKSHDPVELFSSHKMKNIIDDMKNRYPDRYIIIDTPPALLFAETKILSALADGILFVIREGRAPFQHIIEAIESLKDEHLLGIVYNAAGPDGLNGRYSYYSYYDYYQK